MDTLAFQNVCEFLFLAVATYLYAHHLAPRDNFGLRAAFAAILMGVVAVFASNLGFSLHPPLTDDMSFVQASLMFGLVIILLTLGVMALWETHVWPALYCSSSAYLLQSIIFGIDRTLHLAGIVRAEYQESSVPVVDVISLLGTAVVVFAIAHFAITHRLRRDGLLGIRNPLMFFAVFLTIFVSIFFDLSIKDIAIYELPVRYSVILSVVHLAVCVFILLAEFEVLYSKSLETSVATMERAISEQERQFELSRSTIEAINSRVHDMRHHILRMLDGGAVDKTMLADVAREISVYDSAVKSGNAALDVVLTEKKLLCVKEDISFSCIADGCALDSITPSDMYVLFSALLDNAISACSHLADKDHRSISLDLREKMGMAAISLQHYSGDASEADDSRAREIVERYGGTLVRTRDGNVAHVDVLIPRT